MRRREVLKAGLVAGASVAGLGMAQSQAAGNFSMTIVHTNDTHAHIEPVTLTLSGKATQVGGVARRVTLYDRLRATETNPLFLHAGDVFQGTLFFGQYQGLADRYFLHREGVRVMALGNHEFDLGPDPLATFIGGARFPVLSANTDISREPKLAKVRPYTVTRVGGQNIGIVGLTTPDTNVTSTPGPTISFTDPVAAAQKAINELLAKGVNKIVILSHIGYLFDQDLGKKIVGAQLIVGGHSHSLLGQFPHKELQPEGPYPTVVKNPEGKDVVVVQAWEWGKVVGVLRVTFDDKGLLTSYSGQPILMTPDIKDDRFAADAIKVYGMPIAALNTQVVAQTKIDLIGDRNVVRKRESNLSNLIADAQKWKTRTANTQLSLQNGGGVRAPIPTGPITLAKVYEVLPFGNTLVIMDLKGSEVVASLENGVSQWEAGAGRFLSGVSGLRYSFDLSKPVGQRITIVEIETEGGYAPIDPNATYRTVVNNFMAAGGDGYDSLKNAKGNRYDTGFADAESFLDYLRSIGTVDNIKGGRVTVLNEPKASLEKLQGALEALVGV